MFLLRGDQQVREGNNKKNEIKFKFWGTVRNFMMMTAASAMKI